MIIKQKCSLKCLINLFIGQLKQSLNDLLFYYYFQDNELIEFGIESFV